MTRETHRFIKDVLLITIILMVIVIVANSQSHGQQAHLRDSGALLWGGTQGASSSTVQSFIDLAGSLTNNFEVVATGTAASTLTTTVVGCMPGGVCSSTLTSSTGVASQLMTPASSSGPYQTFKVTLSWTGGDATTAFRINRIGVMARSGGGGLPLGLTFASPTLTVSTSGSGNGSVCLSGNTSGTACITAPAVAGTATNSVLLSNALTLGSSTPAICLILSGSAQQTFCDLAAGGVVIGAQSTGEVRVRSDANAGLYTWNNQGIGFGSGNPSSTNMDTAIDRVAANVLGVGNGAGSDESGLLRSANTCRITADVSLTVNVANSFCSFSLPAVAKAWSFRCDIQWAITAGTGTNTFALGVNPSQTPTGTTNVLAQVYTATTGTQTYGSTALSTSGATTALTGATYTPAATVQFANISGTVLASGTAGTFAIQATANGTTATATVKAGSSCWLN